MPTRTEWVPPELRFDYGGVQVFCTYKDDDFDQYVNKYILTTNPNDDDGPRFDVRDIGHALEHNPLDRAPKMFVNDPMCIADSGVRDRVQLEWAAWHSEGEARAIDEILSTMIDWGWLTQDGLKMPEPMQKRRGLVIHSYNGEVGYCAVAYHVSPGVSVEEEERQVLGAFTNVMTRSLIDDGVWDEVSDANIERLGQAVEMVFTEKRMADIGFTPAAIEWRHVDLRDKVSGVTAEHIGERLVTAAAVEGSDDAPLMIVTGIDTAKPDSDETVVFDATFTRVWVISASLAVEATSAEAALERAFEIADEIPWPLRVVVQEDDDAVDQQFVFDLRNDGTYSPVTPDENQ